jgi:hypothetical protein
MRSSWPIRIGVACLGAAAFWYDAKNEAASAQQSRDVDAVETAPRVSAKNLAHAADANERGASVPVATPRAAEPR